MTTTTTTPEAMLAELHAAAAALTDDDAKRTALDRQIKSLRLALNRLAVPTAELRRVALVRDRLLAAKATIEEQTAAAPDHRLIADSHLRDKEWGRQEALAASLRAIQDGVEYLNGAPCLPGPLRALLTDTCPHCGDVKLSWQGPLPAVEKKIAESAGRIAEQQAQLASLMQTAEALLAAEPISA